VSVLVITKFAGDSATLRQALAERAAEFQKVVDAARAQGCIHHQFGIGENFALIVDEWESVEQFQQFFADPELQAPAGSAERNALDPGRASRQHLAF
jgi:hypothetical protein